eukprot:1994296-Pleurochrysis_carterae.AAC.3
MAQPPRVGGRAVTGWRKGDQWLQLARDFAAQAGWLACLDVATHIGVRGKRGRALGAEAGVPRADRGRRSPRNQGRERRERRRRIRVLGGRADGAVGRVRELKWPADAVGAIQRTSATAV